MVKRKNGVVQHLSLFYNMTRIMLEGGVVTKQVEYFVQDDMLIVKAKF
jgi:hypothetical protein